MSTNPDLCHSCSQPLQNNRCTTAPRKNKMKRYMKTTSKQKDANHEQTKKMQTMRHAIRGGHRSQMLERLQQFIVSVSSPLHFLNLLPISPSLLHRSLNPDRLLFFTFLLIEPCSRGHLPTLQAMVYGSRPMYNASPIGIRLIILKRFIYRYSLHISFSRLRSF